MSPDIRWYQAESNPYMPSGEAWVGPDAVLNNLFIRLGAEWDGFHRPSEVISQCWWQRNR